MKQRYEVLLREVPAHVKQMEIIECDGMGYDDYSLEFYNIEDEQGDHAIAVYNWKDVIKVTKL